MEVESSEAKHSMVFRQDGIQETGRQGHKLNGQNHLGKRTGPYMVGAIMQEMDMRGIFEKEINRLFFPLSLCVLF